MATFRQRLASFIAGIERKESTTMAAIIQTANPSARWMTTDYTANAREGFGRNAYVYASITQISRAFAGIDWLVYTDKTKEQTLDEHPLKTLLQRPNPRQGNTQFMEQLLAYLLLDGNSFIQAIAPTNKPPTEMYVLRPDRVVILPGTFNDPIAGYLYVVGNVKVPMPAETIRHFKTFNPLDDWRGMSPMAAAAMSVDQSNASKAWNVALLQNGARPPGAMVTQSFLGPDEHSRIKEMIAEEYSGFVNAGRPLLLEGGLDWKEMGITPADMHWIEGQKLSAREIAIVFNIAPELLGDNANKTYSNYGEARQALYQENILPACDWVRDELNAWLCPKYPDLPFIDYDRETIEALQEDRDAVWGRVDKAFVSGWITINEAREAVGGLDEDPDDGDKYSWELKQAAPQPLGLTGPDMGGPVSYTHL